MYDFEWHKMHGDKTSISAALALGKLSDYLQFDSVLDVGCGDGRWLRACRELGVSEVFGLDGPWTDQRRMLIEREHFQVVDLEKPFDLRRRFDLAMSLEVAEHVPEAAAQVFVDNLVRHSDVVLFGAAIPYQGGFRHIHERWPSYWARLFEARGYEVLDPLRKALWDREDVHFWYKQNMLLYIRKERDALIRQVKAKMAEQGVEQLPLDVVHPEKFEAKASYEDIAFKPLLRKLPYQTYLKARSILLGQT
jgi:SAM-dependent methyltransferase